MKPDPRRVVAQTILDLFLTSTVITVPYGNGKLFYKFIPRATRKGGDYDVPDVLPRHR